MAEINTGGNKYMPDFPEHLKQVVVQNDFDFLRDRSFEDDIESLRSSAGNIFHFAVYEKNVEFIKGATKILPDDILQYLYCEERDEKCRWNPLHVAAWKGDRKIVKVILDYYRSRSTSIRKPWFEVDEDGDTPLHTAISSLQEGTALDILSIDVEVLCDIQNNDNESPTFQAVQRGLDRVAVQILTSAPNCSLSYTTRNITALYCAAECSDEVFKMLVDKAPHLIIGQDDVDLDTVLHFWATVGKLFPFEYVLNTNDIITPDLRRGFIGQLSIKEKQEGYNPLHSIPSSVHDDAFSVKIAEILVNAYKQEMSHLFSSPDFEPPWLMEDKLGHTPLHKAIISHREQLALYLFSLDSVKFLEKSVSQCAAKLVGLESNVDNNNDDNEGDDDGEADDKDEDHDNEGDDDNEAAEDEDEDDNEDDNDDRDIDDDKNDVNLMMLAIKQKCGKVAETMLSRIQENKNNKNLLQLLTFEDGSTILSFAPLCGTEPFLKQLLKTYPEFITRRDDNRNSLLHQWIDMGHVWAINYVIKTKDINARYKSSFIDLFSSYNSMNNLPLHLVASSNLGKEMVDIVKTFHDVSFSKSKFITMWSSTNIHENTPLGIAISNQHEELALFFMSMDEKLKHVGENILFDAIDNECHKVVRFLLDWSVKCNDEKFLRSTDEGNVLHVAWKSTEENGRLIGENWSGLINETDKSGKTPLEIASKEGKAWLVQTILQQDRSAIEKTPSAWIEACENGHLSTVLAFVKYSPYFWSTCDVLKDTPLHHIQKLTYKGYQELVQHQFINELKNMQNKDGETPLHIAIRSNNKDLAEILLTIGSVDWKIKDNANKRAKDLLNEKFQDNREWESMCTFNGVHRMLKAKYIDTKTNLMEMRGTISVVATLLATITITAGFAVPGGVDSDGNAVLSGTVTFWLFVLANTYAMCSAILILFCNTWSMVSDDEKASTLIDRSLWLLKQSLYGTLVAFTIAMYTVIHKKSLWAAIFVAVMVVLVIVLAQRRVLYTILDMLKYWEDKQLQLGRGSELLPLQASASERGTSLSSPHDIENQATESENTATEDENTATEDEDQATEDENTATNS